MITYTENQCQEIIQCGNSDDALRYEVYDMEQTVSGISEEMHLDYTFDVMAIMTKIRKTWGFAYPEENQQS